MKLPVYKRINREDIPDAEDWIGRLLYPINQFFESVSAGLNKNITFQDNIQCFSKTLQFKTKTDYSTGGWNALSFAIPDSFKVRASGLWIIAGGPRVTDASNIKGIYTHWSEKDREININWIGGLADDTEYTFTFMVI